MGFLTVGRRFSNNHQRHHRRPHRRRLARIAGTDRHLRPLPRPQVRSDSDRRLLLAARRLREFRSSRPSFPCWAIVRSRPSTGNLKPICTSCRRARDEFKAAKRVEMQDQVRQKTPAYLQAAWRDRGERAMLRGRRSVNADGLRPLLVRRWVLFLKRMMDTPDPVFVAWREFAKLPDKEFAARSAEVVARLKRCRRQQRTRAASTRSCKRLSCMNRRSRCGTWLRQYGALLVDAERRWKRLAKEAPAGKPPAALPERGMGRAAADALSRRQPDLRGGRRRRNGCSIGRPGSNLTKLAEQDRSAAGQFSGRSAAGHGAERLADSGRAGRLYSRQSGPTGKASCPPLPAGHRGRGAKPFQKGSGRLELAQAIASPQNPLTARVIVNRVWMHHFGAGLVRTRQRLRHPRRTPRRIPSCSTISPAASCRKAGRSRNCIGRFCFRPSTSRPACCGPTSRKKDPENKLLWRMNPTPSRVRADARLVAGRRGQSRSRNSAAAVSTFRRGRTRGAARCTPSSIARTCRSSSAPSTLPAPTSARPNVRRRPFLSRPCSP